MTLSALFTIVPQLYRWGVPPGTCACLHAAVAASRTAVVTFLQQRRWTVGGQKRTLVQLTVAKRGDCPPVFFPARWSGRRAIEKAVSCDVGYWEQPACGQSLLFAARPSYPFLRVLRGAFGREAAPGGFAEGFCVETTCRGL